MKGDAVEAIVLALGGLFCLWAFGKMWFIRVPEEQRNRVRRNSGTWHFFYAGIGFEVEAARLCCPIPSSLMNPYYWGFGLLGFAAVCHHYWDDRKPAPPGPK